MKKVFQILLFTQISISIFGQTPRRLSDYVDPFVGASTLGAEAGKTFPGAASPFGLVQVSPNTIYGGDNAPGYSFEHTSVEGFALTQMSGAGWGGDLGNFLVLPTNGPLKTIAGTLENPDEGYRSRFDKSSETARAGYYSSFLSDYGIKAEMTCTPHSGFFRFTYSKNSQSRIQIDLAHRIAGTSAVQRVRKVNDNAIAGYIVCTPAEGGWGYGHGKAEFTLHFYAEFSKPLKKYGVWSAGIPDGHPRKMNDVLKPDYQLFIKNSKFIENFQDVKGKHLGFYTEFETENGENVLMKVGVSFVSEENAEKNLKSEIDGWNFDGVYEQSRSEWDKALGKITVEGGEERDLKIFYTALYHVMIDPRLVADVDGQYPGGDGKIHKTENFDKRMFFSGWDVFRSQMPLLTIINPRIVSDMINSLVSLADENGRHYLCRWVFFNSYSDDCMVGNPAISVIYDAYAKGIRSFDVKKAYEYGVNTSKIWGNERYGGFVPDSLWRGSVSTTLEYAYTEWCMAQLAKSLGKSADYKKYMRLSDSYQNVWNEQLKWFWPKDEKGNFLPMTQRGRLHENYGAVECNPFQQGWFVPHDVQGLTKLIGGRKETLRELDYLFDNTPQDFRWNDFYNHSNEPVHHIPFLYNRLGEPWKTQKWSRFVCQNAYKEGVNGIMGNEDLGQMSAWYVLAASGLHPVCPGETRFELTSPVFNKVIFNLPDGKVFEIIAANNSKSNIYIQSATLDGHAYNKCFIDYFDIMRGGRLELKMGEKANKKWGK